MTSERSEKTAKSPSDRSPRTGDDIHSFCDQVSEAMRLLSSTSTALSSSQQRTASNRSALPSTRPPRRSSSPSSSSPSSSDSVPINLPPSMPCSNPVLKERAKVPEKLAPLKGARPSIVHFEKMQVVYEIPDLGAHSQYAKRREWCTTNQWRRYGALGMLCEPGGGGGYAPKNYQDSKAVDFFRRPEGAMMPRQPEQARQMTFNRDRKSPAAIALIPIHPGDATEEAARLAREIQRLADEMYEVGVSDSASVDLRKKSRFGRFVGVLMKILPRRKVTEKRK